MPTGFGLNRGRLQLTGLEEPEELWERLKEATAEAQAQAATNKKLLARMQLLERQLADVGGLTDDELVAELPKRMTRALESAQSVAAEIVARARKQEAAIRQKATEKAADIVRQAEVQAANMLENASTQATAHIVSAEGKAQEILRAAQARRQQALAEIESEASALQQRIDRLERTEARLSDAYDVVERTLSEARRALADQATAASVDEHAVSRPTRSRTRPGAPALKVFDWSPATSAG